MEISWIAYTDLLLVPAIIGTSDAVGEKFLIAVRRSVSLLLAMNRTIFMTLHLLSMCVVKFTVRF